MLEFKNKVCINLMVSLNILLIHLITPCLGLVRNVIKYKQINCRLFMRTPLVYLLFYIYFIFKGYKLNTYKILIYERWFWFLYKSIKSIKNNDYIHKKDKYKTKYNLEYKD